VRVVEVEFAGEPDHDGVAVTIDPRDRRLAQPIVNPHTHDRLQFYVHATPRV
jgi:hypothetical protein